MLPYSPNDGWNQAGKKHKKDRIGEDRPIVYTALRVAAWLLCLWLTVLARDDADVTTAL